MDDVRENDQCLFYVGVTIIVVAESREELESVTETVETITETAGEAAESAAEEAADAAAEAVTEVKTAVEEAGASRRRRGRKQQ